MTTDIAEKLAKLKEEKEKLDKLSNKVLSPGAKEVEPVNKPARETTPNNVLPSSKNEKPEPAKPAANKAQEKIVAAGKDYPKKETDKKPEKTKKPQKLKISSYDQKRRFSAFISKAGIDTRFEDINTKILIFSGIITGVIALAVIISAIIQHSFLSDTLLMLLSILVFGSVAAFLLLWAGFFVYVDIKIYNRKKEIELVFPDFLQLTAANINAGMPIDRALWFAIRPRFGILAREMESVAKATMTGENLSTALSDFSNKYDSITIKRALNLLLEGLESGGEIGDLLTRVANNMRETEIIKKEMAANVTTYVIFILFATLGAAPFLFGLTTELVVIMKSIIGSISMGEGQSFGGIGGGMAMSPDSISISDYKVFAIVSICISSTFAAIIISVIQKGNVRDAFKNIPLYIIIGVVMYLIAFSAMGIFLGGMFN